MLITFRTVLALILFALIGTLPAIANDVLLTKEGARLIGKVTKVEGGILYLKTDYAGTLQVKLNKIALAEIETELVWKLKDEPELKGVVQIKPGTTGWILVTNSHDRSISANMVVRAWAAEDNQTEVVTERNIRKMIDIHEPREWSLEAGVNITGRSGNSSGFGTAIRLDFLLESSHDRLDLYGKYEYNENNDRRSADELIGGASYTNFFFDRLGWFVRQELERDRFEKINLRSTSAGGLSYRFMRTERLAIEARAGFSYRYEEYIQPPQVTSNRPESSSFPGLDFGLEANWKFTEWGRLKSRINFLPSFSSDSQYIIEQDSGLYFPLAYSDKWRLRLGLNNKYNSSPEIGRDKLDTSYYLRLIYSIN